jgi:hypothetical protein
LLVRSHHDTRDPSSECTKDDPYKPVHLCLLEKLGDFDRFIIRLISISAH